LVSVALGVPQERTSFDYNAAKLADGVHSTFGMGGSEPEKKGTKKLKFDGVDVVVPAGKLIKKENHNEFDLLYNEFIVYDTKQVRIRYLLEVEFQATA
jgi:poly [ADP-ribose] polymerase